MKNSWQKSRNLRRCVTESALFAAALFCLLFLYKGMYPFGDGSIMMTDLYSQYMPLLYRFYDVAAGEKNLFMDLAVSGGANLYADTINEVLNPFNYVLFFFGRERLYLGINAVLLLYGAGAAASCRYFLEKTVSRGTGASGRGGQALALSLCYAFSGYAAYDYQIIRWMYFPVLFPLFMLALLRLLREKKGGLYGLLLAYQLMLSVQLGFMTLLFTLFAGGFYVWLCVGKSVPKERTDRLACLAGWTAAGLLGSSAVLVPALAGLFSSARSAETLSYLGVMRRHGLDDLFERVFQIGQPVLLAFLIYELVCLVREKRSCKSRLSGAFGGERQFWAALCLFLWLTVLLQPANLLWHLGSYVCFPVRYGYMPLLCMAALTASLGAEREEKKAREEAFGQRPDGAVFFTQMARLGGVLCLAGAAGVTVGWEERIVQAFSSLAISSVCPAETLAVLAVCLLLAAGTLCLQWARGRRPLLRKSRFGAGNAPGGGPVLCAAVCGFCLYTMILLPEGHVLRQENEAAYAAMTQEAAEYRKETAGQETDAEEKRLLARQKDADGFPINAALVSRRGSLSGYFPTEDRLTKAAMEGLGYLAPWVSVRSVGGTAVSDELLRRGIVSGETEAAKEPSGTDRTGQPDAGEESVLARQERMAALAGAASVLERFSGTELVQEDGTLLLETRGGCEGYLDAGQTADGLQVFVNGQEVEIPEKQQAASRHRLICLGSFSGEEAEVTVLSGGVLADAAQLEIGVLDTAGWQEAVSALDRAGEQGTLQPRALGSGQLELSERAGTIRVRTEAAKGELLVLPFMALDGWRCVQNGRNVDIVPVFGGFMGINLEEGENEIVCSFLPPGLYAGLCMTAAGIAAALGLLWKNRAKAGQGRIGAAADRGLAGLYRVLFAGGILGIYVIPALGLLLYLAGKGLGKIG